jgi:hypothetical protein
LKDSVAVGCTKKGEPIRYAGTFTILGELIGKCVRQGVKTAIFKQENIASNRPLVERLADRCLLLETIMSQISEGKITNESPQYVQLAKRFESFLSDRKISSLVIAALRLDEDLEKGLIPTKTADTVDQVSFEEIVQSASKYASGFLAFALDKTEHDDDAHLGPFTKFVLQAILNKARLNSA